MMTPVSKGRTDKGDVSNVKDCGLRDLSIYLPRLHSPNSESSHDKENLILHITQIIHPYTHNLAPKGEGTDHCTTSLHGPAARCCTVTSKTRPNSKLVYPCPFISDRPPNPHLASHVWENIPKELRQLRIHYFSPCTSITHSHSSLIHRHTPCIQRSSYVTHPAQSWSPSQSCTLHI